MRHLLNIVSTSALLGGLIWSLDYITAPDSFSSGIFATAEALQKWADGTLAKDIVYTLSRALLGFCIAWAAGIILGLATGSMKEKLSGCSSVLNYLRSITPVALAPFFLIVFGISEISKILLVAWGAFFPIWVSCHIGVSKTREDLVNSIRLFNLTPLKLLLNFHLPKAVAASYPGARISVSVSFILVYISELLGANFGIGYQLGVAYSTLQIPKMAVALILLGLLGLIVDTLFNIVIKSFTPWILHEQN